MKSLSYSVTNSSSLRRNHILQREQTELCSEGMRRRLYRISIWEQSICYFVPSCSRRRKLHSLLAGGESKGFGVFLSFKPKVSNAGVLGMQAILVDCCQGSQSQWVLRVAEYQGWRTGRHGRRSSSVLKTSDQYQTFDNIPSLNFFQCLFSCVPKREFLWPLCIYWATDETPSSHFLRSGTRSYLRTKWTLTSV